MIIQYKVLPDDLLLVREVHHVRVDASNDAYDKPYIQQKIIYGNRSLSLCPEYFRSEKDFELGEEPFEFCNADPLAFIPSRLFEELFFTMRRFAKKPLKEPEAERLWRHVWSMEGNLVSILMETTPIGGKITLARTQDKKLRDWAMSRRNARD